MTDRDQFLTFCRTQIGKPYALGQAGPNAFDCSGLIFAGLMELTDTEIPRISTDQFSLGKAIDIQEAGEGDLIFFDTGWIDRKPNHNGVCTEEKKMINANGYYNTVKEEPYSSDYWSDKIWGVRRIFTPNGALDITGENQSTDFADVPPSHPYYEFITELKEKGVIKGYPGNLFRPDQNVTRAEALKIILLSFALPIQEAGELHFSDVRPPAWYTSIVETAKNLGIINGYPDGTFRPNAVITRAEISKVICEAGNGDIPEVSESEFADVPTDAWFCKYAHEAKRRDMFSLVHNVFLPKKVISRATMCRAIVMFLRQDG